MRKNDFKSLIIRKTSFGKKEKWFGFPPMYIPMEPTSRRFFMMQTSEIQNLNLINSTKM